MLNCKFISIIVLLSLILCIPAYAQPEATNSKSAILIESDTGEVLYKQDADVRLPIASVTKIMTLCLIFDKMEAGQFNGEDIVTVSDNAAGMGGSQVFLEAGGKYAVNDLIKCIIVASANDACVAMAEYVSGSQSAFVELMNQKASQLNLNNTNFVNCTGMPAKGHYSSAEDVAIMSCELVKHEEFFNYSSIWMDEIEHSGGRVTGLTNTNKLVRFFDGCDGIKTGYTNEAGHCISATVKKGNMRLISVIIGGETSQGRFDDARDLINYGFANYEKRSLGSEVELPQSIALCDGMEKSILIKTIGDQYKVIRKSDAGKVSYKVNLPESINAPVKEGEIIGSVDFMLNGEKIGEIKIAVSQNGSKATVEQYFNKLAQQW